MINVMILYTWMPFYLDADYPAGCNFLCALFRRILPVSLDKERTDAWMLFTPARSKYFEWI